MQGQHLFRSTTNMIRSCRVDPDVIISGRIWQRYLKSPYKFIDTYYISVTFTEVFDVRLRSFIPLSSRAPLFSIQDDDFVTAKFRRVKSAR